MHCATIIAMDGRMWHTSGANITTGEACALLFGYRCAALLRPQMNWNATLAMATQQQMTPKMRHWLGLDAAANVHLAKPLQQVASAD